MPDCERAESKNKYAGQNNCGYGQLPDLVCSQWEQNNSNGRLLSQSRQLQDRDRAEAKNNNAEQTYCGYGQLPDREHDK